MANLNQKLPVFGQPIWIIAEEPLEEKVQIAGERGYLNSLVYFAANAILVKKLEYEGNSLTKIVINRDMHVEGDEKAPLEIHMDLEKNFSKEPGPATIFVDEETAQSVAAALNKNQKKQCEKLMNLAIKAVNEYDNIIAACKVR